MDTNYILVHSKVFTLYLPITAPYFKFNFNDVKSGNTLNFAPTKQYDLGIGISYDKLNLLVAKGISFLKESEEKQGKTKYIDMQLQYLPRRFMNDIQYQKFTGFHVKNSRDFPGFTSNSPYQIRSDISSAMLALNSNYLFNYRKFSYRNSFGYNETQVKSAGSFLAGAYYARFLESGDSALVTAAFTPYFSSDGEILKSTEQTFGANAGYIYTRVLLKKFHAALMLMQGVGLYQTAYTLSDGSVYSGNLKPAAKTNLRFSFGYDSGKLLIRLMSINDFYYFHSNASANTYNNSVLNFRNGKLRFIVGYRFGKKDAKKHKYF